MQLILFGEYSIFGFQNAFRWAPLWRFESQSNFHVFFGKMIGLDKIDLEKTINALTDHADGDDTADEADDSIPDNVG